MMALSAWNGGVIVISHDERFITTVAKEVSSPSSGLPALIAHFFFLPLQLWVCGDGVVSKFKGDVQAYKVSPFLGLVLRSVAECRTVELDR